jgi:hypothetical protein
MGESGILSVPIWLCKSTNLKETQKRRRFDGSTGNLSFTASTYNGTCQTTNCVIGIEDQEKVGRCCLRYGVSVCGCVFIYRCEHEICSWPLGSLYIAVYRSYRPVHQESPDVLKPAYQLIQLILA